MSATTITVSSENNSGLNFESVKDPTVLIPLLKDRLPVSCMIYNQVIQFLNYDWKDDLEFYTIGKKIDLDTWIVSNCIREDYGCNYGISAPTAIIDGKAEISGEIKKLFISNNLINWSDMGDNVIFFVPKVLANMIYDVSANIKGNITEVHPMYLYYMEIEDGLKLEIKSTDEKAKIRRLDDSKNEGNFIIETWRYTLPGTEKVIPKSIQRNASAGLFVNGGKCVCGAYFPAVGYISALYTLPEFRKKGYAKLAMNFIFKECAKDQCIPCLTVELQNNSGMQFFESLGLKKGPYIHGVLIKKLILD